MIWHRLVRTEYISLDSDFISGSYLGGTNRWNTRGVSAIYLGDSPETVISECGKYWICDVAQVVNESITEIKGRPPAEWISQFEKIKEIQAYLAEIEIDDNIKPLNLSTDPPASAYFSQAGHPDLKFDEARKNSFVSLTGHPTRRIGEFYAKQGIPLLQVKSARSEGACGVLFPGNYSPELVKVRSKKVVSLFALDQKENRISGNRIVKLNKDVFEFEIDGAVSKMSPLRL